MRFRVADLLARDEELPDRVRDALAEGRLAEAGLLLMDSFGLSCEEAGELVDQDLCGLV
jgi:hypothetical protein